MATTATSGHQGLSAAEYNKNYAYGVLTTLIGIPVLTAYAMTNMHYMPYLFPINVGIILASIYIMLTNKHPNVVGPSFCTAFITIAIIFCPLMVQHIIHTEKTSITQPRDYYINDKAIRVTPNHIIKNYWSSDALYAHIINTLYDHRTLSVTVSNGSDKTTNTNVNVNDYLDYDNMRNIIQKTYNDQ